MAANQARFIVDSTTNVIHINETRRPSCGLFDTLSQELRNMIWALCAEDASIQVLRYSPPTHRMPIRGSGVGLLSTNSRIADEYRSFFSEGSHLFFHCLLGGNFVPPTISRFELPVRHLELKLIFPEPWPGFTRRIRNNIIVLVNVIDRLPTIRSLQIEATVRTPSDGMSECIGVCKVLERHADVDDKLEEYSLEIRAHPWRSIEWNDSWYRWFAALVAMALSSEPTFCGPTRTSHDTAKHRTVSHDTRHIASNPQSSSQSQQRSSFSHPRPRARRMSQPAASLGTFQLPIRSSMPTPPPSSAGSNNGTFTFLSSDTEMTGTEIVPYHESKRKTPLSIEFHTEIDFYSNAWYEKMEMPIIPSTALVTILRIDFHDTLHDDSGCCELDLPSRDLAKAVSSGPEHLIVHVHFKRFRYALLKHWTCMNYFEYILQKSETLKSYEIILSAFFGTRGGGSRMRS